MHLRDAQPRIACQGPIIQHDVLARIAIAAHEPIAPVIEALPELPDTCCHSVLTGVRIEHEVKVGERDRLLMTGPVVAPGHNVPSAQATRHIDAIVETEGRVVRPQLRIVLLEAGEPRLLMIGPPVAVSIADVQQVSVDRHECAVLPQEQAGREQQAIDKRDRMFVATVAVIVRQDADSRTGGLAVRGPVGVVRHFYHPQATVWIESDVYRIDDVRFRSHQFDSQFGMQLERVDSGRGSDWQLATCNMCRIVG